ncbi:hypothetical protein D9613_002556 [Agrocybe pediades]|uniref:Uncharacterized protein n=1 Tax=Agrocybe pediades TaxID=84607 RepID=A0A8H4QPC3_9AGAR|nr:hypothetical protein D9613_002556 [Agrocybe pediades]KAF9561146.1 hypothetical protein CPC08DRAFT_762260 [Agrocybe pediades]
MNSPPDPGSPSSSSPSSGSPPPEEANFQPPAGTNSYLSNLTSHISNTFGGGGGPSSAPKRRLPSGAAFGAAASARDAKTRRRGENSNGRQGGQMPLAWDGPPKDPSGKKEKDELIDNALVDHLRKEVGDPFQEPELK